MAKSKATVTAAEIEELDEDTPPVPFDLNDPEVLDMAAPEVDPESVVKFEKPQPPADGDHLLSLRLKGDKEGGAVYVKADRDPATGRPYNGRCVAAIEVRVVKEDGTDGAFVKEYYPTSNVMKGQKASGLSSLCVLAGRPCRETTLGGIKAHIETLFSDAGESLHLWGRTRWVQSVPQVDPDTGMPVMEEGRDGVERQKYDEYKGQGRITKMNQLAAQLEVSTYEIGEDESVEAFEQRKADRIKFSEDNPHAFIDPVDQITVKYASAEVAELIKPPRKV